MIKKPSLQEFIRHHDAPEVIEHILSLPFAQRLLKLKYPVFSYLNEKSLPVLLRFIQSIAIAAGKRKENQDLNQKVAKIIFDQYNQTWVRSLVHLLESYPKEIVIETLIIIQSTDTESANVGFLLDKVQFLPANLVPLFCFAIMQNMKISSAFQFNQIILLPEELKKLTHFIYSPLYFFQYLQVDKNKEISELLMRLDSSRFYLIAGFFLPKKLSQSTLSMLYLLKLLMHSAFFFYSSSKISGQKLLTSASFLFFQLCSVLRPYQVVISLIIIISLILAITAIPSSL